VQTFTAEDRWKGGISAFVPIAPHKRIVGVGRAMHIFEYQKLENPEVGTRGRRGGEKPSATSRA
jgi:hypothetical protein